MATWTDLGARSRRSVQLLAGEVAPTLATDGINLTHGSKRWAGVKTISLLARAEVGRTFTGTGTMLAYIWNELLSIWVRSSLNDLDCSALAGVAAGFLPTIPVEAAVGRITFIPFNVGASGGTTITVDYIVASHVGAFL